MSERESEILLLAADGLTDKQIAERVNISEGSVRTYWDRTRQKLGVRSRGEAIAITLRQAFEQTLSQLREVQEWARVMVECSRDYAIFRTDRDGTILTWNPGVAALLLYKEEEFVGRNIAILFTEEDQLARMAEMERKVAEEAGRSLDNRWHVRRDGVKIWVEGTLVQLRGRDDEPMGFAKIMQDRTEELQAKGELERVTRLLAEARGVATEPPPAVGPLD